MSEKSVVYNPETIKLGRQIGEMIRKISTDEIVLKGPYWKDHVIEALKVCLYELEADEEIQAALFEYRNKSKKNTLTMSVKVIASDIEPIRSLVTEIGIAETGICLNQLSATEACNRIFDKYNEIKRSINESRDD